MAGPIDAVVAIHNAFRQDMSLIDAAALDSARGKPGLEATVERFLGSAIMGVFGAMGVLGFKLPHARRALLQSALFPIVLTLGNGLLNPGISNAGHIGGLIGGVLVAAVLTPARAAMLRGEE